MSNHLVPCSRQLLRLAPKLGGLLRCVGWVGVQMASDSESDGGFEGFEQEVDSDSEDDLDLAMGFGDGDEFDASEDVEGYES